MRRRYLITAMSVMATVMALIAPPAVAVAEPRPERTSTTELFDDGHTRLAGADRYQTAVRVSQMYEAGVPAVFVATGENFPDALSAAAAASLVGVPLLLTPTSQLPAEVLQEIERLAPEEIFVVGSRAVVSDSITASLSRVARTTRLQGADRYATGLKVVNRIFDTSTDAVIATGRGFADALAASGAAGAISAPVILVDGMRPSVDRQVIETLERLGVTHVHLVGGSTGAVSSGIQTQLSAHGFDVARHGGADRYLTAAAINEAFFWPGSTELVFLTTGSNFPDALAGAALAGALAAPIFVTTPGCVPGAVRESIVALGAASRIVLGGTSVVSETAASNIGCLLSSVPTISGALKAKSTLTVAPGTWTAGTSLSANWYADGVKIGTGGQLTLTNWEVGKRITVKVTGTLAGYTTITRSSAASAVVASGIDISGPPRYPHPVVSGAFCASQYEGWIGVTVTGQPMRCSTSSTDDRLRWRAA